MKPIFLISLPRAGSTLLQRILMGHSAIASKSEPWIMLPLVYMLKPDGIVTEYNHRDAVIATHDFINGLPAKEADYNRALHDFVLTLFRLNCARNESLYLDKTPRYYLIIDELAKIFPEAKFIFLVRNPIQIISSIITSFSGNTLRNLHFYHIDIFKGIDKMAQGILAQKGRSIVVRYEDLVVNPQPCVQTIVDFLDLTWEPGILDSLGDRELNGSQGDKWGTREYKAVESKSIDKWKDVLCERVRKNHIKQIIMKLSEDSLNGYGYGKQALLDELDELPTRTTFSGFTDLKHIIVSAVIKKFYLNLFRKKVKRWSGDIVIS